MIALAALVVLVIGSLTGRVLFVESRAWRLRRQLERLGEVPEWNDD